MWSGVVDAPLFYTFHLVWIRCNPVIHYPLVLSEVVEWSVVELMHPCTTLSPWCGVEWMHPKPRPKTPVTEGWSGAQDLSVQVRPSSKTQILFCVGQNPVT